MKYYLYDFDGTIYDGDSSVDFFLFCLKKNKKIIKMIPKLIWMCFKYFLKMIDSTEFKSFIFTCVLYFDNIDDLVKEFWISHEKNLKDFYLIKKHDKDIIISASPSFILKPICEKLKVKDLIATEVDLKTGKLIGKNNVKNEKVINFYNKYPKAEILEMYSDSENDKPLLDLAQKSIFVKKNKLYDYKTYKPNIIKRFWNLGWSIYHKNEELWNYLIVGGLTTLVSIVFYALCSKVFNLNIVISNIISWIFAVVFAYFTNRKYVFKSKNKKIFKEFIEFTSSRLVTLFIDTLLMIVLVDALTLDDLIAKIIVQVVVIIGNYFISKLFIFKK